MAVPFELTLKDTLTEHTDAVTQILVRDPLGHKYSFLSASRDGSIIYWAKQGEAEGPWEVYNKWDICSSSGDGHYKAVTDLGGYSSQYFDKFVSSSLDGTVIVWNLTSGMPERKFKINDSGVLSVAITKDGRKICIGSRDRTVRIEDMECKGCKTNPMIFKNAHASAVKRVRFNPLAGMSNLVSCGGTEIKFWDMRIVKGYGGDLNWRWGGPEGAYAKRSIEFGSDGLHFVSGGDSEMINLWKFRYPTNKSQILKSIKVEEGSHLSSAKFSPNLRYMAAAKGNKVFIFDMKNFQNVAEVQVDENPEIQATSLDWSHNAARLYVGISNGTIKIFKCKVQVDFEPMSE